MLLVFKEMESWIIYDFFIYIPIPLNRNDLSQINIYYVNFDKPIIISTFVAIILAIVSHWAARIILHSGNSIETIAFYTCVHKTQGGGFMRIASIIFEQIDKINTLLYRNAGANTFYIQNKLWR